MSGLPSRPLPWRGLLAMAMLALIVAWASWQVEVRPGRLFSSEGLAAAWAQAGRLLQPSLRPEVLLRIGDAALTTVALATTGSVIAAVIALGLLPFACESLLVRGALVDVTRPRRYHLASWTMHYTARLLANSLRTVPYLVWALLLILLVGLGPKAAALALGLHTGGVLARLFAGAVDALDPTPLIALRNAGASRVGILLFGMLPQVWAQVLSLWFYRWEVNLREATVLGMVAAGGLGHELSLAFGQFAYQTVSATLLAIVLLVLAGETLSGWVRRRLA